MAPYDNGKPFLLRVKHSGSGLCMSIQRKGLFRKILVAAPQDNSPSQLWAFNSKGQIYNIQQMLFLEVQKGKVVMVEQGKAVMSWQYLPDSNYLISEKYQSVVVVNPSNEYVLQPHSTKGSPRIEIVVANDPVYRTLETYPNNTQKHNEALKFYICSKLNGLVLDVSSNSKGNNSVVHNWELNGQTNQQWQWKSGTLVSVASKKVLAFDEQSKRLVIQDPTSNPQQQFFLEKVRYGFLIRNINRDCIRAKWGMINKRARLVLDPYVEDDLSMIWDFDFMPSYQENPKIKNLGGWGDRARQVLLRDQCVVQHSGTFESEHNLVKKAMFWKPTKGDLIKYFQSEYYIAQEMTGANIASYLTDGLVVGCRKSHFGKYYGVQQLWVDLDNSVFTSKQIQTHPPDFNIFNDTQCHELLIHCLSDRLISNWDFHHKNYAVNQQGNVVSFDKEQSFAKFSLSNNKMRMENAVKLELTRDVWRTEKHMLENGYVMINKRFIVDILEKGMGKRINPEHPLLQKFYKKCEEMTFEQIHILLGKYADLRYKGKSYQFQMFVLGRIRDIRRATHEYFGWQMDTKHAEKLAKIDKVWQ